VGWIQAHPTLLAPFADTGVFQSGNNPVTFSSSCLAHFIRSGALAAQIRFVCGELARKCDLLVQELRAVGLDPVVPNGGYFVWVRRSGEAGRMTGRNGSGMSLDPPDQYKNYMRLCFAWLSDDQIVTGARYLAPAPLAPLVAAELKGLNTQLYAAQEAAPPLLPPLPM
jgi:DNA-binding transcriptional MocR family regulator